MNPSTAAPPGTCANSVYAGPFALAVGTHTVYYAVSDNVGNGRNAISSASIVALPQLPITILSTTTLPAAAGGLTVTPLGNFIYVSQPASGQVLRMSLSGKILQSFGGFGPAGPGALTATDGEGIIAADPSNAVARWTDFRGNLLNTVPMPAANASGLAFVPDQETFFVSDETGNQVLSGDAFGDGFVQYSAPGQVLKPRGVAVGLGDSHYIVDSGNARVQVIDAGNNFLRQFGIGLTDPASIALAPDGTAYVSDRSDHALHVFDSSGNPEGVVGGIGQGTLDFGAVAGLATDPAGRLYVGNGNHLAILARPPPSGSAPVLGALTVDSASPWAINIAVDAPQPPATLYELRVSPNPINTAADFAAADPSPVAGSPSTAAGAGDLLRAPGLAPNTNYYVALRAVDAQGRASNIAAVSAATIGWIAKGSLVTVAGDEGFNWLGDGGPATLASFGGPAAVARDAAGNLYVADLPNVGDFTISAPIRRIDAVTRVITTYAGGLTGFGGDGGPALQALFNNPRGLDIDAHGNMYIGDSNNNRVRRIDAITGIVTTVAGTGAAGFSGDGGPATQASLNGPREVVVDAQGDLFIAEALNNRVRRVDPTGIITTVAGNGTAASTGDGGPATQASLNIAFGVALSLDAAGDLYVAERMGNRVRKVDGRTGIITTVAGNGTAASAGDGGPAVAASLHSPVGLALDPVGNLYIAERDGNYIRRVDVRTGIISTVAGDGTPGNGGEDGPALAAEINFPLGLFLDPAAGLLYVTDGNNTRLTALGIDPFLTASATQTVAGLPALAAASTGTYALNLISTQTPQGALFVASATTQGLSPASQIYIVQPTGQPGAPVALTFAFDPAGASTSAFAIYRFNGVFWDSGPVTGQTFLSINGVEELSGITPLTSPFAVFRRVVTPPSLTLSPPSGSTITVATPAITAVYFDTTTGVNTATFRLIVDGVNVTTRAVVTASSATYVPTAVLAQGTHTVTAAVADFFGNAAASTSTFFLDSVPPQTSIRVDGLSTSATALTLISTDTIGFVAVDSGTGVAQTRYAFDGGALQINVSTFSLAVGSHTLTFQSADYAGNAEALHAVFIAVLTPPTVAIISPEGAGYGVVIKGVVPILGTVSGYGLASWRLEYAPGQSAASGFVLISSGTLSVAAGTLGGWNTASVSGWQTLRLTALNSLSQSAAAMLNVYAGPPSLLLSIAKDLERPSGVAVSQSGYIYVADTNNDRVTVLNSMGGVLASFGNDRDGHKNLVALNKPQGVAVDVFGNVYVADTKDNRAVKLSSMGQLLFEMPKLGRPQGIALDGGGNVYVSDTDNSQVKKFSMGGALMQTFFLAKSKPAGLAVDASNRLYVADPPNHRVLVFAPSGVLLKTIGPGLDLDRPTGVAVSPSGGSLVVSDARGDKLFKLDGLDEPTLIFGRGDKGLRSPRGLAFDAAGDLYVADSGRDRVLKLGPPLPGMPSVPVASVSSWSGEVTAVVTAKDGGRLLGLGRSALFVPPGAVSDDLEVTLSTPVVRLALEEALKSRKLDAEGLISVSTGVQCGPEGTTFLTPASVVVPYDFASAQAAGLVELGLQVYAWDPDRQQWAWLSSVVDPHYHTVTAKTMHLSHFKVAGKKPQN